MATIADSDEKPSESPLNHRTKSLEETPWIAYAAQQAQLYQQKLEQTFDSAIVTAKTRLSEIRSTSSAHLNHTLDSLENVKSEYSDYDNLFFGKLKEGAVIAASNPAVTCGAAFGLGILAFKWPRRFLTSSVLRLFVSEEAMLSRADVKVKELRQSINLLKAEGEKLEKQVLQGEEELRRGQLKLRQSGKQIQDIIGKAYKIERQAIGLKDIVGELPSTEASRFRSQISNLASETKKERNDLTKKVSKIINYGISI